MSTATDELVDLEWLLADPPPGCDRDACEESAAWKIRMRCCDNSGHLCDPHKEEFQLGVEADVFAAQVLDGVAPKGRTCGKTFIGIDWIRL